MATSGPPDGAEPEVLVEQCGALAVVTLNRPKVLNSLSTEMVRQLLALNTRIYSQHEQQQQQQQQQQQGSPQQQPPIACVLVRGAGGKAFCAGGDVKSLVLRARAGEPVVGTTFFRLEYANNAAIAQLPVPYIAVLDGIVMGGGVGASVHGHFRVATERTVLAMPEAGIGLFPDVGASFFLLRLPGFLGRFMGLTGERLTGAEVQDAGFATHFIPSSRLPDLEPRLKALGTSAADPSRVDALLRDLEQGAGGAGERAGPSALLRWKLPLINAHFGHDTLAGVVASLESAAAAADRRQGQASGSGSGSEEAGAFLRSTLAAMRRGSPLSQAVTWEMLHRSAAGHMTLRQCLEMEFVLAARFVHGQADFMEGVRAVLIDKDGSPQWRYGSIGEVPEGVVRALFEPLPGLGPLFEAAAPGHASRM